MQQPLQIIFREIAPSDAVDAEIRRRVEKLERLCQEIISCRVTAGLDNKHKHQGNLYRVLFDIAVPGDIIIAENHPLNEDIYVAMRDAFEAASRQLDEYVQRRRREVKNHTLDKNQP